MSLSIATSLAAHALPEVHDEVLIAFEHGQPRAPFVVGPLWNSTDEPPVDNAAADRSALPTRWSSLVDGTSLHTILTTSTPTRDDREAQIKDLEEKLNAVGDDAQLANVDMQDWLQKEQQTLQMLSNVSKMMFDTAMAIIRKIGG